jgi:hypothetical protein
MKSKDFIQMLQAEDPTGETHVRLPGGTPIGCIKKQGYYDGAYFFIDEQGNFVISDRGEKVDIIGMDLEEFIWEQHGDTSKVIVALRNKKEFMMGIERIAEEARAFQASQMKNFLHDILLKMKEGYKIVQPISEPIGKYNCMVYIKDPKKYESTKQTRLRVFNKNQHALNQGECGTVLLSGFFKNKSDAELKLIFWEFIL